MKNSSIPMHSFLKSELLNCTWGSYSSKATILLCNQN